MGGKGIKKDSGALEFCPPIFPEVDTSFTAKLVRWGVQRQCGLVLFYSTFGIGMMMGKVLLAEFEMTAAKLESLQNDPDGTYALGKLQCSRISALPSLHHCFCATASGWHCSPRTD